MAYDPVVVQTAYKTAVGMGASGKVLLALFEAAIVESGFRNLSGGPDGSQGFLQQRASQGWTSPMDVATATRSFVSRAMSKEGNYATAGQLAQSVQISAFPLRYDAVRVQASTLLSQVSSGTWKPDATGSATTQDVADTTDSSFTVKVLRAVQDAEFWKDLGFIVGGFLLIMMSLGMMVAGSGVGKDAVKAGAAIFTKGIVK